jgi:hypothetical protein
MKGYMTGAPFKPDFGLSGDFEFQMQNATVEEQRFSAASEAEVILGFSP